MNKEEKESAESYEGEEWQSVARLETEKERYRKYAYAAFRKDARVNIRISSEDLEAIRKKAIEEGIPYQSLMASILHKFVSGRLVEQSQVNESE